MLKNLSGFSATKAVGVFLLINCIAAITIPDGGTTAPVPSVCVLPNAPIITPLSKFAAIFLFFYFF